MARLPSLQRFTKRSQKRAKWGSAREPAWGRAVSSMFGHRCHLLRSDRSFGVAASELTCEPPRRRHAGEPTPLPCLSPVGAVATGGVLECLTCVMSHPTCAVTNGVAATTTRALNAMVLSVGVPWSMWMQSQLDARRSRHRNPERSLLCISSACPHRGCLPLAVRVGRRYE